MMGTINCKYETPCGWCTKWDKKCDKKIGCDDGNPKRGLRAKANMYDDASELSCYRCKHQGKISLPCADCHPIFKNFEPKEN